MTFARMVIMAMLIVALGHAETWQDYAGYILLAFAAWSTTDDPLPAAVDRGLEAFKKRHMR